jgi:transposase
MTPEQQRIQELEARVERLEREKTILKNVWSAPDLQVTGLQFRQNNVCVNVSGLLLQSADCWP